MFKRYSSICLVILSVIAFLVSCTKTTEPKVSYFVVKVDSIAVPDSISHSDTLKIKLYGTIGNNGNYSFDHYEATRDSFKLNLKIWGKYVNNDVATMVMVMLDGAEYPVCPVYPNKFKIFIRQPDSSVLSDSVAVWYERAEVPTTLSFPCKRESRKYNDTRSCLVEHSN